MSSPHRPLKPQWRTTWLCRPSSVPALLAMLVFGLHALSVLRSSSNVALEEGADFSSLPSSAISDDAATTRPLTGHLAILMRSAGASRRASSLPAATTTLATAGETGAAASRGQAATRQAVTGKSGGGTVFVSFANSAMFEFIQNWVMSVQRLGAAYVIGALDRRMSELCASANITHLDLWRQEGTPIRRPGVGSAATSDFFRTDLQTFRSMGATKIQLTLSILEADNSVDTVVVSDSDTVWLRDPQPYFDLHPTADWFISTDCLSHRVEAEWRPKHNVPRCGHIPGNIWGRAYNTGVFAVRNRPAALKLLREWRDMVADSNRSTVTLYTKQTFDLTDQMALNVLLEEGQDWELNAPPEDPQVTLARSNTLRLHPLPVLLFPGGHVAFVQRLPWRHGQKPYVVHATFQRYGISVNRYAKRARFREFGMWFLDGPEYYSPPGARYLTYTNDVRRFISQLAEQQPKGVMPLMYRQIVAVSYQLALFRDALAVAQMTNRTLVLPQSWCWCDYDWTPHVVEKCKIRGSDLELPFECPADFVFHIPFMEMFGLDYRVPGFLEDPRAPAELRRSRAVVQVAGALHVMGQGHAVGQQPTLEGLRQPEDALRVLPLGASEGQVRQVAARLQDVAVLTLSNMQPGLVRGFESHQQALAFDAMFHNITDQLYWCCADDGSMDTAIFWYELPRPLSDGYQPWHVPVMPLPWWCDSERMSEEQREWVSYANHPCQFLRNETAAAVASALS